MWYYKDTLITGFLVTPLFGIVIPSALCYILVIFPMKKKAYQSLAFFAGDKIYTNRDQNESPAYIQVCDESAVKLLKSTSTTLGIVLFSMIILLIFPPYAFITKNDIQLPIPVILPFTDLESKNGITLNMANQVFIVLIGATGNIGIEIITCILKNNVWASTVVICYSIDEISEFIEHPEGDMKRFIDLKFRNILIQVQDLDRFILGLSQLYYWKFFLQPIMLTFSVSFAIFFYLYGDWTSGLGTAFLTYTQLYILCDIGNEVDLANKMLVLKFQKMPWHLMSKENQLRYAHMLNRLQNGAVLRIGPFAELNFETFSDDKPNLFRFDDAG
ncbi:uncharacterized protein LOC116351370 [Contarinia nasturtii]|uniref:uncharacterized protein LOC116351370 n=1 Tax=Contarinia nasturtii TaxID=265458 RepID=UPI0012D3D992|nr:uncharacterized protein LOC116351370 [Contarinia nasturtii]